MELEEQIKALTTELERTRERLKWATDEAKGHRLTAESFRLELVELRRTIPALASEIYRLDHKLKCAGAPYRY